MEEGQKAKHTYINLLLSVLHSGYNVSVALKPLLLRIPCYDGLQPGILSQTDPFSFWLVLLEYFVTANRNKTKTKDEADEWLNRYFRGAENLFYKSPSTHIWVRLSVVPIFQIGLESLSGESLQPQTPDIQPKYRGVKNKEQDSPLNNSK